MHRPGQRLGQPFPDPAGTPGPAGPSRSSQVPQFHANDSRPGDMIDGESDASRRTPADGDGSRRTVRFPSKPPPMLRALTTPLALLSAVASAAAQPNLVFILCDDLGWGDLGVSFQNQRQAERRHATPNLDRLAAEGAQLRGHYCPAPVCAPSRASLLGGLHQGHAAIRDNQFDKALPDDHSLASVLRTAGYHTALVGKYGLQGPGRDAASWPAYPTRRGFDEFLGYVRHRDGHVHYPAHAWDRGDSPGHRKPVEVWHNDREISSSLDKCFTSDLFTAYAKKWITEKVRETPAKPFFLFLAYDTPHAALQLPPCPYPTGGGLDGGVQWLGQDGRMINTAAGEVDGWVHPDHQGWSELEQRQAGMIRRIDDHIADLARLLRDLRIAEDTLVVFSSDNGPHTESYLKGARYRADLFQAYGPFDGIKRDTLEGGIRVPGLAWWPGTIPAGRVVEGHSQFHDWLNTFLDAAGAPLQAQSDGVSLLPSLTGEGTQETPTTYVEYQVGGRTPDYRDFAPKHRRAMRGQMQAVFLEGYKGLRRNIQGSDDDFQIFDLSADPSERRDLAESSPKFRDLQQQMKDRVLRLRRPNRSAPRPYDGAPMPALPGRTTEAGVDFAFLAGEFPWVPVIGTGQGTRGEADGFEIEIPAAGAVEVSGYLEVPEDGEYAFKLTAPDAAVLHVHQALVVDGDTPGEDGGTLTATARLEAGLHPFRLRYLSAGGNATLAVDGPAKVGFRR